MFVTAVTALQITGILFTGVAAMVAQGPIATCTISVPGKVTYVPTTGHTNIYWTVEEWYPDALVSERNLDVKFTQADISIPGSGNATIQISAIGLDQSASNAAYFSAPSAETTTDALQSANGLLLVDGTPQAILTDLSFSMNGNGTAADGVVGTNIRPDVFMGKLMVTGSFTCYFEGGTIPDLFRNETQTSILTALAAGTSAAADFMAIALTAVKLNTSTPDDGELGLKRTYSFTATMDSIASGAGTSKEKTTIQIQDSQAA